MAYARPEHRLIAEVLQGMNHPLLLDCKCWFGGGTAIVLLLGEYRLSLDVDFLCADVDGYREIRNNLISKGPSVLFGPGVTTARDVKADGYGIRLF